MSISNSVNAANGEICGDAVGRYGSRRGQLKQDSFVWLLFTIMDERQSLPGGTDDVTVGVGDIYCIVVEVTVCKLSLLDITVCGTVSCLAHGVICKVSSVVDSLCKRDNEIRALESKSSDIDVFKYALGLEDK